MLLVLRVSTIIVEDLISKAVKIGRDDIHIMVLFWIVVLRSDIRYLIIVVFLLICFLVDDIFKDKYLWIL